MIYKNNIKTFQLVTLRIYENIKIQEERIEEKEVMEINECN